jgi:hypothetical protein
LGLEAEKTANSNDKLEAVVNMLIGMRNQARADKNFKLSDQIRDQLIAYGIQLKDGKKELPLVFKNLFFDQPNSTANYLKYVFKIIILPFVVLVRFYQIVLSFAPIFAPSIYD